jgi:hypothetical protein
MRKELEEDVLQDFLEMMIEWLLEAEKCNLTLCNLKTKEYYNAPVYIDHTVITIFIVLSGFRE